MRVAKKGSISVKKLIKEEKKGHTEHKENKKIM